MLLNVIPQRKQQTSCAGTKLQDRYHTCRVPYTYKSMYIMYHTSCKGTPSRTGTIAHAQVTHSSTSTIPHVQVLHSQDNTAVIPSTCTIIQTPELVLTSTSGTTYTVEVTSPGSNTFLAPRQTPERGREYLALPLTQTQKTDQFPQPVAMSCSPTGGAPPPPHHSRYLTKGERKRVVIRGSETRRSWCCYWLRGRGWTLAWTAGHPAERDPARRRPPPPHSVPWPWSRCRSSPALPVVGPAAAPISLCPLALEMTAPPPSETG